MSTNQNGHRSELTLQALTQRDIEEWIQHLVVEVATEDSEHDGPLCGRSGQEHPHWIPAGELVRRMNRFLSRN